MSYINLDEQSLNALLHRNSVPAKVACQPNGHLLLALTKASGMHWLVKVAKSVGLTSYEIEATGAQDDIRFTVHSVVWALIPNFVLRRWVLPPGIMIVENSITLNLYAIRSSVVKEILEYAEITRVAVPGEDGAAVTIHFEGKER